MYGITVSNIQMSLSLKIALKQWFLLLFLVRYVNILGQFMHDTQNLYMFCMTVHCAKSINTYEI